MSASFSGGRAGGIPSSSYRSARHADAAREPSRDEPPAPPADVAAALLDAGVGAEYASWIMSVKVWRLATSMVWTFALSLGVLALLLALMPSPAPASLLSLRALLAAVAFAALQAALQVIRFKGSQTARAQRSLCGHLTHLLLSPAAVATVAAFAACGAASAWLYASLAGLDRGGRRAFWFPVVAAGGVLDGGAALYSSGALVFSALFGARCVVRSENAVAFPSLQRGRVFRVQARLLRTAAGAGADAAAFAAAWHAAFSVWAGGELASALGAARAEPHDAGDVLRLGVALFAIGFCWRLGRHLTEVLLTERLSYPPDLLLYALAAARQPWERHAAMLALHTLASSAGARDRAFLFGTAEEARRARDRRRRAEGVGGGGGGVGGERGRGGRGGRAHEWPDDDDDEGEGQGGPWRLVCESCLSPVRALTDALLDEMADHREASALGESGVFRLTAEQRCRRLFADAQLLLWATQSLSLLAGASLGEDRGGTVQYTLHAIFDGLAALQLAVESYAAHDAFLPPRRAAALTGHQLARAECSALIFSLDNSLYRLVSTFYEDVKTFAFCPAHARRLNEYFSFQR